MSAPDEEISEVGGSVTGADDEDGDNDDDDQKEGSGVRGRSDRNNHRKIQRRTSYVYEIGCGGTRNFTKAKKIVLFPFTKVKKHLHHRRKPHEKQPPLSTGDDVAAIDDDAATAAAAAAKESSSGNIKGNRGVDRCFCFSQPQTLESSLESQISDPDDPCFTYDMLKALIENNDFYSKECNPHSDSGDLSCCGNTTD